MTEEFQGRRRYGCALVLVGAVGIAALLFYPAVRAARMAAEQSRRADCLRKIGLALYNFHDHHQRFPAADYANEADETLSSWRFQIAPYMEADMQDIECELRWDDPANQWLTGQPHRLFCFGPKGPFPEGLHTNVVAITGPGTVFDGRRQCCLSDIDPADTILAIEIARSGTPWAAPGDLSIDQITAATLKGLDGLGLQVLFADGSVGLLDADVPLEDFKKFLTVEGAKRYDRHQVLGPYLRMR